jgi:DNA-binding protein Alba
LSRPSNVVYIGRKPPMSYVTAIITSFTRSNTGDVTLKARGQAITTAVDAAEITRRRFMKDLKVDRITIGTEELEQREGGTRNVSTMEIKLTRAPQAKREPKRESEQAKPVAATAPTELTSIEGIGGKRAEKLKTFGINSVKDLAKSDAKELAEKIQVSEKRVSKWVDEAKAALGQ